MFVWNSKTSVYYAGKRPYKAGDKLPKAVVEAMGEETLREYIAQGLITEVGKKANAEKERLALLEKAKELGLSPHPNTGIEKLRKAIADAEALAELKKEALSLGIDPRDNVTYAELKKLVDEAKADESN